MLPWFTNILIAEYYAFEVFCPEGCCIGFQDSRLRVAKWGKLYLFAALNLLWLSLNPYTIRPGLSWKNQLQLKINPGFIY